MASQASWSVALLAPSTIREPEKKQPLFGFGFDTKLLGILSSFEAPGLLILPELIVVVGKNVKYSHLSSCGSAGLAQSPAGFSPSVHAVEGAGPPAYTVNPTDITLKHIHWERSGSKTFEGICSNFPQCSSIKTYRGELFIFRMLFSSWTEGPFDTWKGWNFERKKLQNLLNCL